MAEKKNNKVKKTDTTVQGEGVAQRKLDPKKLIVVLGVMLVVIVISFFVDKQVNSRPVTDINDATNRMFAAGVFSTHPEIEYETEVEIENMEPEEINGKLYFPVKVTLHYDTPEAKVLPMYYVEQKNGDIFVDDGTGKLVPWGV